MLAIPPFGGAVVIALWRANIKPPLEVVVDNLVKIRSSGFINRDKRQKIEDVYV